LKRVLLLSVSVLLSLSALLAIAILLVGRFGSTEGRILGTTALLAGYGLVALPGVVLLDKERAHRLALTAVALGAVSALLALVSVWSRSSSDTLGRTVGSATVVALAISQVCALTARRDGRDPASVTRLFALSCASVALAAILAVTFLWTSPHGSLAPRVLGAVVVVDLLLVALQPILARARPSTVVHRFDVVLVSGERIEVSIRGGDLASAAARAIRSVERERGSIVELDIERDSADPPKSIQPCDRYGKTARRSNPRELADTSR
jgi:FtsH-binding integral membrane protein